MPRDLLASGDTTAAVRAAQNEVDDHENEVQPLADLVNTLWQAGQHSAAQDAFETLRTIAAEADLDSPPLARLKPIAAELKYPVDWRITSHASEVIAQQPMLDTFGPPQWQPWQAPDWKLQDVDGKTRSLSDYRGKPTVVVFYLGSGCLHCIEQLHAFAKKADRFSQAGLSVVAISLESPEDLAKAYAGKSRDSIPFDLVANPDFTTFKQYRCYDDFENIPLHGTFLVDAEGYVRWQDTGAEPFMDVDFLIDESQRLLPFPIPHWTETAAATSAEQPNANN